MQLGNDILGKTLAVVVIIVLTLHHRISGILVLIVIIAFMQNSPVIEGVKNGKPSNMNYPTTKLNKAKKEGFTPMVANSIIQDAKNYVKDNANNVKDKLKESFSRYRS